MKQVQVREFLEAADRGDHHGWRVVERHEIGACGEGCFTLFSLLMDETQEVAGALQEGSRQHVARELADVLYVAYGLAEHLEIPLDRVFAEVHAANMRKVSTGGQITFRSDGKVLKPDGWFGPDAAIAEVLG